LGGLGAEGNSDSKLSSFQSHIHLSVTVVSIFSGDLSGCLTQKLHRQQPRTHEIPCFNQYICNMFPSMISSPPKAYNILDVISGQHLAACTGYKGRAEAIILDLSPRPAARIAIDQRNYL